MAQGFELYNAKGVPVITADSLVGKIIGSFEITSKNAGEFYHPSFDEGTPFFSTLRVGTYGGPLSYGVWVDGNKIRYNFTSFSRLFDTSESKFVVFYGVV